MNGVQRNGAGTAAGQSACASCKHQRKRCDDKCVLSPYFPANKMAEFQAVQKVFGVSNMTKMVQGVAEEHRKSLAESLIWEAMLRQRDPVLGAYGEFRQLQKELVRYQSQLAAVAQLNKPPQPPSQYHHHHQPYEPTALVSWSHANGMVNGNGPHGNGKEANGNGIVNGKGPHGTTESAAYAPHRRATAVPIYAKGSGQSSLLIDPSQYGSVTVRVNGQNGEVVNHQEVKAQRVNGFGGHQPPYYGLTGNH